jgi:hypothetical protein
MADARAHPLEVRPLQDLHPATATATTTAKANGNGTAVRP